MYGQLIVGSNLLPNTQLLLCETQCLYLLTETMARVSSGALSIVPYRKLRGNGKLDSGTTSISVRTDAHFDEGDNKKCS